MQCYPFRMGLFSHPENQEPLADEAGDFGKRRERFKDKRIVKYEGNIRYLQRRLRIIIWKVTFILKKINGLYHLLGSGYMCTCVNVNLFAFSGHRLDLELGFQLLLA